MKNSRSANGVWELTGAFAIINDEIPLDSIETPQEAAARWLLGDSHRPLDQLESVSGLRLKIEDESFSEEKLGDVRITWYDEDGVLCNTAMPFDGWLNRIDGETYLVLERPTSAATLEERTHLRCDDGDTQICDCLRLVDGDLIRTISVVTDELYLDRVMLRYEKVKAEGSSE